MAVFARNHRRKKDAPRRAWRSACLLALLARFVFGGLGALGRADAGLPGRLDRRGGSLFGGLGRRLRGIGSRFFCRLGGGLHPKYLKDILGKNVNRDLEKGTRFALEYVNG